jgi:very-short-patch-repair endonuclease
MRHAIWVDRDIRGEPRSGGLDGAIAEIARRQHGVVARRQLTEVGLSDDAIDRRLRAGRLLPLHRGVYALGYRSGSRESAWMAAVLAGGRQAVLSHRSAAAVWGLRPASTRIDVTTPRGQDPRRGIRFHRSKLPADETTVKNGIPVTTVPRTLFDLAALLDHRRLERALNEAEVLQLWDELSLHDLLRRHPRRHGNRAVRALLQARRAGPTRTKSDLEVLFLTFADRFGLPQPETNALVEGLEVDCVWRAQRLVIEVDGWATHRTRAAFERDREKSRVLQAAGWRCVAVTSRQMEESAHEVARDVRRLLHAATLAA